MAYKGFDIATCPTPTQLQNFWTNTPFSYTAWYCGPNATNASSYVGKAGMIRSIGYGLLVVFVGKQNGSYAGEDGSSYAMMAEQLVIAEKKTNGTRAIRDSATIFLDIEGGGPFSDAFLHNYVVAWCWHVYNMTDFFPGVYCSYAAAPKIKEALDQYLNYDNTPLGNVTDYWIARYSSPPSPGCTVSTTLGPSACGLNYTGVWQYAASPHGTECKKTYNGTTLGIDLNVALLPNPSGA